MSNDFYNNGNTLIPGSTARAEDVTAELDGIEAGFDKLPTPRPDGQGFVQPIKVGEAVDPDHCATRGQLIDLEQQAADSATTANQHKIDAQTAQTAAETAQAAAETAETNAETAEGNATTAHTNALLAQGAAEDARDKAQEWAEHPEDTAVEAGQFSAKHWAIKAEQTVLGAKVYQGTWDASGGTFPSGPVAGYFWTISVAGTLNSVAYAVGDELSYNGSAWERIPNSSAVSSVNSQVGDVNLTAADVGAAPTSHGHSNATTGVAGYMSAADKSKLDGIEANARADQTGAEIKAAYEGMADTNAFTDSEKTKLSGIAAGAQVNPSASSMLASLLTVDGAGSGLDADTIDGIQLSGLVQVGQSIDASNIINVPAEWTQDNNTWRPVSDSVSSNSSSTAASSAAVKSAYDLANTANSAAGAADTNADSAHTRIDGLSFSQISGAATAGQVPAISSLNGSLSDAQLGIVAQATHHVRAGNMQLLNTNSTIFDDVIDLISESPSGSPISIGKTGSGATKIWPAMDFIPTEARVIILLVDVVGALYASSSAPSNARFANWRAVGNNNSNDNFQIFVPLSASNTFEIGHDFATRAKLYYQGFLTD